MHEIVATLETRERDGYRLSLEKDSRGKYRIKAEPIHPYGYMFYAYETYSEAENVMYNLSRCDNPFTAQTYCINFNPTNAKYTKQEYEWMREAQDIRERQGGDWKVICKNRFGLVVE